MSRFQCCLAVCLSFLLSDFHVNADDWSRFRGPNGSGIASSNEPVPVRWSPTQNVKWKLALPGAGVSSPIVVGDKIFVTCYSGYGLDRGNPGDINQLKRHLVCVNAKSGEMIWEKSIDAVQPEDPYTGAGVPSHGYASHSPVSDGKNVYVFFGKTGAFAFDFDGNQLWHTALGTESDSHRWGSASSPILHGDKVIVTASAESQALVALDKTTGEELWRQEAKGLDNVWGTPALAKTENGVDLVVGVAGEVWGINPDNGKLRWYALAGESDQASTSAIVDEEVVIIVGSRGSGSMAVRAGGQGDVTDSHVAWTGSDSGRFATPVAYNGTVYLIANDVLTRTDEESGEMVDRIRLSGGSGSAGGGRGGSDYASPIVVNGKLYYVKGNGDMFVFDVQNELKQLAVNRTTTETESFSGSPAYSNGNLFVRSDKHLYCVVAGPFDESSDPAPAAEAPEENETAQRGDRGRGGAGRGAPGRGEQGGGFGRGGFGNRGGGGDRGRAGGRGGFGGQREDNRPDRPQRPPLEEVTNN
ncbi:outer membrane protein assembly factor BamB family protein [Rhodopirellula sp. P2]|uniref:outer membrane protein assembly factor BamB family protein n=1 Tax=Rhodopirellula sp. P2 TaxID=2127060 RepID=UPI002367D132|nr:PQQ-binding-like beta-propeller repeat protein [Rhodopirellula sp. P2]WDQ16411.1 PQQ-binding-like beta-propeller repeat protein [Rhodopirellula sp. P2]